MPSLSCINGRNADRYAGPWAHAGALRLEIDSQKHFPKPEYNDTNSDQEIAPGHIKGKMSAIPDQHEREERGGLGLRSLSRVSPS